MARIMVDLHPVYNNSRAIDQALDAAFSKALDHKIGEIEIITGKGSGQLRKRVHRYLQMPGVLRHIHRIENDFKNSGRVFVYFRFNR